MYDTCILYLGKCFVTFQDWSVPSAATQVTCTERCRWLTGECIWEISHPQKQPQSPLLKGWGCSWAECTWTWQTQEYRIHTVTHGPWQSAPVQWEFVVVMTFNLNLSCKLGKVASMLRTVKNSPCIHYYNKELGVKVNRVTHSIKVCSKY